jgi:SAM-dependent methyltransferase
MKTPDWAGSSGDVWARRWRDTDRALDAIGAALDRAICDAAPGGEFRALDVGCGPGTTALALADNHSEASILGCDVSRALIAIAQERSEALPRVRFVAQDAEDAAREYAPFDLIVSRHGVMFFEDPHRAFAALREAASPGARLVFSCFGAWEANAWAAELACAAAGRPLAAPGREPGGFAFAEPEYVADILLKAGWADAKPDAVEFEYVAGDGPGAAEQALSFLAELGPAARVMEGMDAEERETAMRRMRAVIGTHQRDGRVAFPAAAWIWTAAAR